MGESDGSGRDELEVWNRPCQDRNSSWHHFFLSSSLSLREIEKIEGGKIPEHCENGQKFITRFKGNIKCSQLQESHLEHPLKESGQGVMDPEPIV